MNEELFFEYPLKDEREKYEAETLSGCPENLPSARTKAFILLCAGFIIIPLSDIFPSEKISTIAMFAGVILIVISLLIMKSLLSARRTGVEISAYETYIEITSLDNMNKYPRRTLIVSYSDIVMCDVSNDGKNVMLIYKANVSTEDCVDINGEKAANVLNGTFPISVNPYTYEHFFFLYTAPKLFKVRTKVWKTVKKFGTEYEYAAKYLQ